MKSKKINIISKRKQIYFNFIKKKKYFFPFFEQMIRRVDIYNNFKGAVQTGFNSVFIVLFFKISVNKN